MGYTNYLRIKVDDIRDEHFTPELKADLLKLVNHGKGILYDWEGEEGGASIIDSRIVFNGKAPELDCETCVIPLCAAQCEAFSFCKTRGYPYDAYVLAAYFILKHHLGALVQVSSDGYSSTNPNREVVRAAQLYYDIVNSGKELEPLMLRWPE